jgi:hypothetical protein
VRHTKHCTKCNTDKPLSEYQKRIKNGINVGQSYCRDCRAVYAPRVESNRRTSRIHNPKSNPQRMFVSGKYIPKSHPLYKAGNFKTFEDAAFNSLSKYTTSSEGEVYIITNPAWKGWIKIGMAIDANDRCNQYQTSSPMRDYKLKFKKYFDDRRTAEQTAHTLCAKKANNRKGEWFKLDIKTAKDIINNMEIG